MTLVRNPQQIIEELAVGLECPVCFEFLSSPIFTCVIGHMICARCCGLVKFCPLCRDRIIGTRSFFAEESCRAINKLLRICRSDPQIEDEIELDADQVRCCLFVNGCQKKLVEAAHYVEHLKLQHSVYVTHSATGRLTQKIRVPQTGLKYIKRGTDRLFIMEVLGRDFIVNMIQERELIRIWVTTRIKSSDKTQHTVDLSVLDANSEILISWSGAVKPLHTTDRGMLASGDCLKIFAAQLKPCFQEDLHGKYWKLRVQVKERSKLPFFSHRIQNMLKSNFGFSSMRTFFVGFIFFLIVLALSYL